MVRVDKQADSEMAAAAAALSVVVIAAAAVDVLTLETETPTNTEEQTEEHWDTVEHMSWICSAQGRSSWPHDSLSMPPICY